MTAPETLPAAATQVGGRHYKDLAIQPLQYVAANGLGPFEAAIVKYVTRWQSKGGVEDLRKARHYLDWLIELNVEHGYPGEAMTAATAAKLIGPRPAIAVEAKSDWFSGVEINNDGTEEQRTIPECSESVLRLLKQAEATAQALVAEVERAAEGLVDIAPITDAQLQLQLSIRGAKREAGWARDYLAAAIDVLKENPGHE